MSNQKFKFAAPLAFLMLAALLITSCQKEDLAESNVGLVAADAELQNREIVTGQVIVYDCPSDTWSSMSGVNISIQNCAGTTTVSNGDPVDNYSLNIPNNCMGGGFPLCMEFITQANNNVTTLDAVAVTHHISGTTPFTSAREYLAADVNRDGQINTADVSIIQQVAGGVATFPFDNELFIPFEDYDILQNMVDNGTVDPGTLAFFGLYIPHCITPSSADRRYIKTGDLVDGAGCGVVCNTVTQGCGLVTLTYCTDGTLTAHFNTNATAAVHYLKIWETGWQNPLWFCTGNDILGYTWEGAPACQGTQSNQLDPTKTYFIELNGGMNLPDFTYPVGTQLCDDDYINLP